METIVYKRSETSEELDQILSLQAMNFPDSVSDQEKTEEGFVTARHNFDLLDRMHRRCAHIIAVNDNEVVGYALCMHASFKDEIDILKPMFAQIKEMVDEGLKYIVMGQICIKKQYRKMGIFKGLYNFMRSELDSDYSAVITEVDAKNKRSLNAHYSAEFKTISNYKADGHDWLLMIQYWN